MKQRKIVLAVSLALGLAQPVAYAQFDAELNLSALNGANGFVINGVNTEDFSGHSVSQAGDINNDGIDDLIIGANFADPNSNDRAGTSYVVFGSNAVTLNPFNLSSLDGLNGFVINGVNLNDFSGSSVSQAGDVNGDGIDDLIIGAPFADPNNLLYSGSSYVIFGSNSGLPNPMSLEDINGLNGFVINGVNANDNSGFSVSAAGDVNGDGMDDIIIGANFASPNGNTYAGSSFVVFGNNNGLPSPFNLSTINGLNGFVINGVNAGDRSGTSVSQAGDINGDGLDDLIIGAKRSSPNGNTFAGSSYVVFGSNTSLPNPFNLSNINGLNGFVINGESDNDESGSSVNQAGDINGDGIDDLVIGVKDAGSGGKSYVIYGSNTGLPSPFNLSNINGINGFVINGVNGGDRSGRSVSLAGDINSDGIDDLIIGADSADPNAVNNAGNSYVVFGSNNSLPNPFNLSTINGLNGFVINGTNVAEYSGNSVSQAGDINGDGIDDLIIGAYFADSNGNNETGKSYVVFGREKPIFADGFE